MSPKERQEFWASLSLRHSPGLGPRTARRILERYGSAAAGVEQCRSWAAAGLATSQQCQAFALEAWREDAEKELASAEEKGLSVLNWSDPRYPQRLREIPDPPVFLYWAGDLQLLDAPGVAVVGSRECSRYGMDLARRIARELSEQGLTVVSGLAQGIDREAHLGGLEGPGASVAVMGTGPDLIYPASNRDVWLALADKGLILSEFPPGAKPLAGNFPLRNRIISGVSLGVLVVEASTRSGSLITARLAMEQGRDVFAVPGPVSLPSYRGCHEIINRGARLVHCAQDILEELKPQLEAYVAGKSAPGRTPRPGGMSQASLVPHAAPAPPRQRKASSTAPAAPRNARGATPPGRGTPQGPPATRDPQAPREDPVLSAGADGELEEHLAGHLAAEGATHIDALCRVFDKDAKDLSRILVLLELKGVVRRLPGGYYHTA